MTDQQTQLVIDNHNLIYYYIHKYLNGDIEEWYDILAIGLCKAAINYDPSKGAAFSTYACFIFSNEVKYVHRKSINNKHVEDINLMSLDEIVYDNQAGKELTLLDMLSDKNNYNLEDTCISNIAVRKILSEATGRDKKILSMFYNGCTQREIGRILGVSQPLVSRTLKRIKKKYKELI